MRDVAERLREMPGRLRVGGVALVKNGKRGGKARIAQILVKLGKLPGGEQPFVDDGLRRKRAEIGPRRQERFRALSQKSQTPLEADGGARWVEWLEEELPDFGHGFQRPTP